MPRWRVMCDVCGAGGWIGPRSADSGAHFDAWCEGCQRGHALGDPVPPSPSCTRCGGALTLGEPRFEELLGDAQDLAAVLHAWCGDPGPLAAILPDRPRLLTDPAAPDPMPGDAGEADDTAAHLARGVLRAQGGDYTGARQEFALAGDRPEARWNRAAVILIEAVESSPGPIEAEIVKRARLEVGDSLPDWIDQTVGRLLWTLLVERAIEAGSVPTGAEERALRSAEQEFEFRTFWDRALVVHGYAMLGMKSQAGEAAAAIVDELLRRLAAEPYARGPAGRWLSAAFAAALAGVRERRPGDALAAIRALMERPDVSRYRVPCVACGSGSLGVEPVEEAGDGDGSDTSASLSC